MQNVEKILSCECGNFIFKAEELEALAEELAVSGKCLNSLRDIIETFFK